MMDDFNRADENPLSGGGRWGARVVLAGFGATGAQLVSNAATGTINDTPTGSLAAAPVAANSFAVVIVRTLPQDAADYVILGLRFNAEGTEGYFVQARRSDTWFIFRGQGGANTQVAATGGANTLSTNDVLRFEAIGTTLRLFRNATLILEGTDGNITGAGRPALGGRDNVQRLDDFWADGIGGDGQVVNKLGGRGAGW